jgi:hypothetical protein
MKGLAGIIIAGIIFTGTLILTQLIPLIFLHIHIVRMLEMEYKYNNADLVLLTLLSNDEIYESLSLYVSGSPSLSGKFDRDSVKPLLKEKLDKITESVGSKCYKLSTSTEVLAEKSETNCKPEFKSKTLIVVPYEQKIEKLTLVIG